MNASRTLTRLPPLPSPRDRDFSFGCVARTAEKNRCTGSAASQRHVRAATVRRRVVPPGVNSISGRALRIHIKRIERMARSHEQPIALATTEAKIGAALWQRDKADRLAFGIEHLDAVEVGVAHAPAAPQIAIHVDAEAVRRALRFGGDQDALVGKPRSVIDHVESIDVARGRAAVLDVAFAFVGRKLDAVRAAQRALYYGGSAGFGVEAIDVRR